MILNKYHLNSDSDSDSDSDSKLYIIYINDNILGYCNEFDQVDTTITQLVQKLKKQYYDPNYTLNIDITNNIIKMDT